MNTRLIPVTMACCLALAACGGGSDDSAATTTTTLAPAATTPPVATDAPVATAAPETTTTVAMVVDGATVVVANGNIVGGSAGRMTDELAAAGFTTGAATNGSSKVEDSVVYYTAAAGAQPVAESLAAKLGVTAEAMPEPIPTEDGALEDAAVLLLLGNNQADKTLDELSGGTDAGSGGDAVPNGTTSTVVVGNANTIGGSAGRMSAQLVDAGYTVGEPANSTEQLTDSIVYFSTAEGAQADAETLAAELGIASAALPAEVPTEDGSFDGDVLLLLGSNEADQPLSSLGS